MIVATGWISAAGANDACLASAQSDLERLYCEVVELGGGAGLPSMVDFKRNDPKVQALLLRQPAKRLSLTLPEVSAGRESESKPARKPAAAEPQREPAKESVSEPSVAQGLADCQLRGELIQCPNTAFKLAGNRTLASLEDGVLEPGNRLGIVPFNGARSDDEAVRSYLSTAYDRYIPKMLAIGLGANTMSFTAFHNAFHTLESGGVDFSERMEKTYELLKQDRKTLGVKARYHDELPENLAQCVTIDRSIIVCDNVGTNWVFVRTK
ncbi:hypothetical protein [Marinobacter xiaoshiensis]|uniref:Uncharacterized protein n=2 Tax=Marinobacter TaxID=2742 RepID=A0ABU2HL27_9GAMM|nr:hypothetical protein [Marinobacter sp. F60267]MDS1311458.1 hypothetical protein [Marinobacter sp. F60267]